MAKRSLSVAHGHAPPSSLGLFNRKPRTPTCRSGAPPDCPRTRPAGCRGSDRRTPRRWDREEPRPRQSSANNSQSPRLQIEHVDRIRPVAGDPESPSSSKAMPSGMCRGMWTTRSKGPAEPSGWMAIRAMLLPIGLDEVEEPLARHPGRSRWACRPARDTMPRLPAARRDFVDAPVDLGPTSRRCPTDTCFRRDRRPDNSRTKTALRPGRWRTCFPGPGA